MQWLRVPLIVFAVVCCVVVCVPVWPVTLCGTGRLCVCTYVLYLYFPTLSRHDRAAKFITVTLYRSSNIRRIVFHHGCFAITEHDYQPGWYVLYCLHTGLTHTPRLCTIF